MSDQPDAALAGGVIKALQAQPLLTDLVGSRIFDGPAAMMDPPCLFFTQTDVRPWGGLSPSAGMEATEHVLSVTAVSRSVQIADARTLAGLVRATLHDAPLDLSPFRLVNLRVVFTDVYRAADAVTFLGVVRLRAVVEPA